MRNSLNIQYIRNIQLLAPSLRSWLVGAALGVSVLGLLGTGCATVKYDLGVFQKKKLAVAAFYAPKLPELPELASLTFKNLGPGGAAQVLHEIYPLYVAQMQQAMEVTFIGANQASAHSMYSLLHRVSGDVDYVSYQDLKPLLIDEDDDVYLGKLATLIQVDAVVLISHAWAFQWNARKAQAYATDHFEILIVGNDGKRLWFQKGLTESEHSVPATLRAEDVSEKEKLEFLRDATLKSASVLAREWAKRKP
jgi:hypothetical protein